MFSIEYEITSPNSYTLKVSGLTQQELETMLHDAIELAIQKALPQSSKLTTTHEDRKTIIKVED